jgi:1-deoxyxylulose-5-phosphate synthase
MDRSELGRTGIEVSRLCIGTGTIGWAGESEQTRKLGLRGLSDLLIYSHERGINFIDSADQYGTHKHIREALKIIPREEVVITTKTTSKSEEQVRQDLERFRYEIGTDYIDIVLLHCVNEKNWNSELSSVMDALSEAKEKNIVRAVGCSNHNYEALYTAVQEPWVDVILVRLNPKGIYMEDSPNNIIELIRDMKKKGKGVYSMKVMGNGELSSEAKSVIRFQLESPVDSFTIGMMSNYEIDLNIKLINEIIAEKQGLRDRIM